MAFQPRVFDTILVDMINHMKINTTVTDYTIGSVVRTILEAAALEDDEQYFQMVQILDGFKLSTATGSELDERGAEYNINRLESAPSTVSTVQMRNGALTTDSIAFDISFPTTSVTLLDSTDFPISYPYIVRLGEGLATVEDVTVSNNNTDTGVLTTTATTYDHEAGERVSIVSGGDLSVASGTLIQVPASGDSLPIQFQAVETAIIVAGNYASNLVKAVSTLDGSDNNVGAGRLTQFAGSVPFAGAEVTNLAAAGGGRDQETDDQYRDRIKVRVSTLSRGTPYAIEGAVKGLEDPDTGQRVVSSKLLEDFTTEEHILYIDDGTGFTPDTTIMATSSLAASYLTPPVTAIQLGDASNFPSSGIVLISPEDSAQAEVISYSSKTTNTLNLDAGTAFAHNSGDQVILIDYVAIAEEGQNYFRLHDYPLRRNSLELYDNSSGAFLLKTEGTDYFINRTNGEIQYYGAGLPSGTVVVANYTFYTGLLALAQKVINGDPEDPVTYPGVAAAGNIIYVDTPEIHSIQILSTVSVKVGSDEDETRTYVTSVIENYINGLGVGENVILAKIVGRVMNVAEVENFMITYPTSDVTILESEVAKAFDSGGNTLVTVK